MVNTIAWTRSQALEERGYEIWLYTLFESYLSRPAGRIERSSNPETNRVWIPLAPHHRKFWEWVWSIEDGEVPQAEGRTVDAEVNIWPRGGAKSTHLEIAMASFALRRTRRYGLYISDTQDRANDHLSNISAMLGRRVLRTYYPSAVDRRLTDARNGEWRRARIQTATMTIDALGMDSSVRGARIEEDRPDIIALDDLDSPYDSGSVIQQKIQKLTRDILPARAPHAIVVYVQNLVHRAGIAARIIDGRADFLANRIVSGPIPALWGFNKDRDVRRRKGRPGWDLLGGTPSWVGQDLDACQAQIDTFGLDSFLTEAQHDIEADSQSVYPQFSPAKHRWRATEQVNGTWRTALPDFRYFVGGLDFGSEGASAHFSAGCVAGVTVDNRILVLDTFRERGANIAMRHMMWMAAMEEKIGRRYPVNTDGVVPYGRVRWAADGTQFTAIQLMRQSGFDVTPSEMGEGKREQRVRNVGSRLSGTGGGPGLLYLENLEDLEQEFLSYKRVAPKDIEAPSRREILRVNDDLMTTVEYMVELVDGVAVGWSEPAPKPAGVSW